jgi:coenzyme F420 hydrogenase subunit beta
MTESRILYETVIKNGYCIGCGACSSIPGSPFKVKMDLYGNMVAQPSLAHLDKSKASVLDVCPFSNHSKNEDELGAQFYPENQKDDKLGNALQAYAGYVNEKDFRNKGSSGGMGKWIGYKLMQANLIDKYYQISSNKNQNVTDELFKYKLYESSNDIINGSKSAYYPATMQHVLAHIRENEGRYAITGVPCFIKALRLLMIKEPILKERIKYTVGLVCGGMKSANQAKFIGWQMGIKPENLTAIDFRRKYKDKPASHKIYQVWSNNDNKERYKGAYNMKSTDYGAGYFKPKACDYCDDVVGETADISIGDAWIDEYSSDPKGNNLVIVRNPVLLKLLNKSADENKIKLDKIPNKKAVASQSGGFRHRRDGLSYRLSKLEQQKKWYPRKRVKPGQFDVTEKRRKIFDLREKIAEKSHVYFLEALEQQDLSIFFLKMKPLDIKYHIAKKGYPIPKVIKETLKKIITWIKPTI